MSVDKWLEISIRVPSEDADLVAEYLSPLSRGGAVVEQEVLSDEEEGDILGRNDHATVKLYHPLDQDHEEITSLVAAKMEEILPKGGFSLGQQEIQEEEWSTAWRAWFKPLKIGPLLVTPPWTKKNRHDGLIPVIVDPGMAFGTGSHPTTRLCLRGLIKRLHPGDRILDAGTGSGILAIAAAKLGASYVLAFDVDDVAVDNARSNIEANGVANLVNVRHCTIDDIGPRMAGSFDLVLVNISSRIVALMAEALKAQLKERGTLIVSGISSTNLGLVEDSLKNAGMADLKINRQGDWRSITCTRD